VYSVVSLSSFILPPAPRPVKVENSLDFAAALRRCGVPFDLHVYQQGRHGIGLADKEPFANPHPWAKDLVFWLKAQGFVK
jgi:dipeptidyl aminopeptidase/acylaminoacyl peptidase